MKAHYQLLRIFDCADEDGDGYLCYAEMFKLMMRTGASRPYTHIFSDRSFNTVPMLSLPSHNH